MRYMNSLVALMLMAAVGSTGFATVNHGSFGGGLGEISYIDVTETTATPGDPEPLYGAPIFSSPSTLVFRPTEFAAAAPPSDQTSSLLEMLIEAPEGQWIQSITVYEIGDYALLGEGAVAQASAAMFLSADANGLNVVASDSDGVTLTLPPASVGDFGIWEIALSADVSADQLESVYLSMDNTLQALAPNLSLSFIQKKLVRIDVTYIPEPATLGLMALGTLLIARRRR